MTKYPFCCLNLMKLGDNNVLHCRYFYAVDLFINISYLMQTRFQVEMNGHFPIIYFLPFL